MPAKPETLFLDIGEKNIQLVKGGEGPPLVYLHSAGGETEWMPFHAALAERFTVYAPAHPGFSVSTGLDEIDNMVDLAWHYVDLFAQLGLSHVPVVGFSLGAWLGAQLAILRPELVSKLVLTNAAGLHVAGAPMADLFIDDFEAMKHLVFFNPKHESVDLAMPSSIDDPRILHWLRAREATARLGWNPYLHDPKLPQHLKRIACPTLVLWGRQDALIPLAHGEYYAQHIPGARLAIIENCGHMAPFEKCDEFVEQVVKFVKG
jgi:pimeloyl-ACP methyl ester carboxylesterase